MVYPDEGMQRLKVVVILPFHGCHRWGTLNREAERPKNAFRTVTLIEPFATNYQDSS